MLPQYSNQFSSTTMLPVRFSKVHIGIGLVLFFNLFVLVDYFSQPSPTSYLSQLRQYTANQEKANSTTGSIHSLQPETNESSSISGAFENPGNSTDDISLNNFDEMREDAEDDDFYTSYEIVDKPLIIYAYADSSWAYENLRFFLTHGFHTSADFVFILNGALANDGDTSYEIPKGMEDAIQLLDTYKQKYSNIQTVPRNNTCYDLGSYGEVLLKDDAALFRRYQYFILMNASLRGPFVPLWSRECWSNSYLWPVRSELKDDKNRLIKLVGMTENCWPTHHIQSMLLATDAAGMEIMLGLSDVPSTLPNLSRCPKTMADAIDIEVHLTPLIMEHNYTARAMTSDAWAEHDKISTCHNLDLTAISNAYGRHNLGVWETMFSKTKYTINTVIIEDTSAWLDQAYTNGIRRGSLDVC